VIDEKTWLAWRASVPPEDGDQFIDLAGHLLVIGVAEADALLGEGLHADAVMRRVGDLGGQITLRRARLWMSALSA